ncbi:MAG: threonine--tRNA ligase [Oscillospiraceae bacterium]|jgi:threonyl-tRNA synthetase|nr:threonine--tRNA ligase [Oscillospiraceae bacterium]
MDIELGRHSLAHVMAKAVCALFSGEGKVKLGIGPAIDNGFYYDFDLPHAITEADFAAIESKMTEIIKAREPFAREELSREQALALFAGQDYKEELIRDLPESETLTAYQTGGDFVDLCRGPHVGDTGELRGWAYKIASVAGAYWRGDERRPMLQRVYVYAYPGKAELKEYLNFLEEAQKRDHRKLGPQLDLFFLDESAPGMPYYLPNGLKVYHTLLSLWREVHEARGYQEILAPQLNLNTLWKTSGHWDHYQDNMFLVKLSDEQIFGLKPMNCPNAILTYQRRTRSYRELPLRIAEIGHVHRKEISGTLHGLLRVQSFHQDDSHNFVTEEQIASEINEILDIADLLYAIFGFEIVPTLSTRPDDFMGDIALWNEAELRLKEVLNTRYGEGNYRVDEGGGAFYGPKIDIKITDALRRVWQTATIQVDFQLPRNFNLTYTDRDGQLKVPVVIHRAIYGSLERFLGILIEQFAGKFPFWLAPCQVGLVPVQEEEHGAYADEIAAKLRAAKIRVKVDHANGTMGNKIKGFRQELLPYIIIVGDQERDAGTISLRARTGRQTNGISVGAFLAACEKMNETHALELAEL